MWSWLSFTSPFNGSNRRLLLNGSSSIMAEIKREFSLTSMQLLHAQLLKFQELPDVDLVELLRVLSEFLIYSDQNRLEPIISPTNGDSSVDYATTATSAGVFFDYFCEKNILGLLVEMGESSPRVPVQIQLLQTLSILVQNIATQTSLYYILSNNYVNKLIECPFDFDKEDDVRDWYVTLLKALSLRLNEETVQFFFDSNRNTFPLYVQALQFGCCNETMIKVAVKTLTLNVFRVQDDRVRRFVLEYERMKYFTDVVEYANEIALKIQGLLNLWQPNTMHESTYDKLEEAIDEYIDHCFYLQDILDVNLPELCYKVGEMIFVRHIKEFLAASLLPDCNPPPQRVSTRLALYLLTRFCGIFEHAPLLNAISFLLLCPNATDQDCQYSAVALGAGSRRRSVRINYNKPDNRRGSKNASPPKSIKNHKPATAQSTTRHEFRAHSQTECDSALCYLQTRYQMGEWPADEVQVFVPSCSNCFRQSLFTLVGSKGELLASAAVLLLIAMINCDAVDHSLLHELSLLPYRHRRHKRSASYSIDSRRSLDESAVVDEEHHEEASDVVTALAANEEELEISAVSSSSSSSVDSSAALDDLRDLSPSSSPLPSPKGKATLKSPKPTAYTHWLVEFALHALTHSVDCRLLNLQLCARLLLDATYDGKDSSVALKPNHAAMLQEIHSSTTYSVMQSMRGAMSDVDLFIYVLEDEYHDFETSKFPLVLNLKSSMPSEFLVPHCASGDDSNNSSQSHHHHHHHPLNTMLALRKPTNEMENCRKSMRAFLILRRLRALLDPAYKADALERLVTYRHPHSTLLCESTRHGISDACCVGIDGMVYLKCIWREQRFFQSPAPLLIVLNPEMLVLVERQSESQAIVRLCAPIHRAYSSIDAKDDLVLHFTISSATPVHGCRPYHHRIGLKQSPFGHFKSWHVSVLFEHAEDCRQVKAHVDLCRAEVRAYKLLQIEEALLAHAEDVHWASSHHSIHSQQSIEDEEKESC